MAGGEAGVAIEGDGKVLRGTRGKIVDVECGVGECNVCVVIGVVGDDMDVDGLVGGEKDIAKILNEDIEGGIDRGVIDDAAKEIGRDQ